MGKPREGHDWKVWVPPEGVRVKTILTGGELPEGPYFGQRAGHGSGRKRGVP